MIGRRTRAALSFGVELIRALVETRRKPAPSAASARSVPVDRGSNVARPSTAEPSILAGHLGAVVDKRLRQLRANRNFPAAADPVEALHDLRVASRRLRAFVGVFEPLLDDQILQHAKRPLRRVTRAAGELRDLDVQVGLFLEHLKGASTEAERAAVETLLEHVDAERRSIDRRTRRRIAKIDFEALHEAVCAVLGETVAHLPAPGPDTSRFTSDLLEGFVDGAASDAPAHDGVERPEAMHALRVRVKKLRYALELFQPVLGDTYPELYARAEALQELLGSHHDLVVLGELVEQNRAELASRGRNALAAGLAALRDGFAADRTALFERYRAEPFDAAWWREKLASVLG